MDICCVLPCGKAETEFLQEIAALLTKPEAKAAGSEKVTVPKTTRCKQDRFETKFRGFAFDLATATETKGNFDGCLGSGGMELMRRETVAKFGESFWSAVLLFKLVCHAARVT